MEPFSFDVERLRRRLADVGPAQGHGARRSTPSSTTASRRRRPGEDLRPRVNHPLTIGDTEVFLIGHGYAPVITVRDGDGRRRLQRADDLPADRPDLPLVRRDQGAGRASRARSGSRASSTRRSPSSDGATVLGLRQRAEPADLDARLHRRPRPGRRRRRSRSTSSTRPTTTLLTQDGRRAVPRRPAARASTVELPNGLGLGQLRRRRALEQDPDQPDPGQAHRAGRRRAGPARAAGLAVHPAPPGVGARPSGGRRSHWSRSAALDRSGGGDVAAVLAELVAALPVRADPATRADEGEVVTDAAVGDPEQPGASRPPGSSTSWPCWPTWWSGPRCARCRACRPGPARLRVRPGSPVAVRRGDGEADASAAADRRTALFGRLGLLLTVVAVRRARRRPGRPRHGRGPQPGAVGQHVRVHAQRAPSWSRCSTSCC